MDVPSPHEALKATQIGMRARSDGGEGADRAGRLEVVSRRAVTPRSPVSLLFVHGINVGAWIWEEHFLDRFAGIGFDAHAVSLRGHGRSRGTGRIRDWRLADYVDDLEEAVDRIGGPLVLVGHSMGGAVVQKFVQRGRRVSGMVLMASVPPWGLAPAALRIALSSPRTFAALVEMSSGRPPTADVDLVRRMLFTPHAPDAEVERFMSRVGPESPHVALELQGWPPLAPAPWLAPDTFVIGGGDDALVPSDEVRRTAIYYGCPFEIVPEIGHMPMIGPRWRDPAARLERWLVSRFQNS